MTKRKWYWLCGLTIVVLAGSLTALGAAIKHEPAFYVHNQVPPGETRKLQSGRFLSSFGQMLANRKQEKWSCDVTETEMNSFFGEIFDQMGETEGLRRIGISSPTVVLEEDRIRLGFRYGAGAISTVISYDLKIWLVPKEPNVIAVEFLSARAGALPISNRAVLQQLCDFAQKQNFQVTLYRHEGNTVAVIDLRSDAPHTPSILTTLEAKGHHLAIRGKTLEAGLGPLELSKDKKKVAAP